MIVYPALVLRAGRAVLLTSDGVAGLDGDPVAWAARWRDGGARWLHVLSLDGPFAQAEALRRVLHRIERLGLAIQLAGGLDALDAITWALDLGVRRVVLGAETGSTLRAAVQGFGADAVAVALDVWGDRALAAGWQVPLDRAPVDLARDAAWDGARLAVYTDLGRVGTRSGADVGGASRLVRASGLDVIAAGGVRNLDDLNALSLVGGIAGVIVGRALYDGSLSLERALLAAAAW